MKVLVVNGSPKGNYSTTLHSCLYIEKKNKEVEFSYLNAGQKIRSLEKDFTSALQALESADLILFSYPVYTFLVPAQLHRFIELMKESGHSFEGKTATQLTTSKHFYDLTAHRFIQDNCADLGINYIQGLSADMDDLLTELGQKQATDWFDFVRWSISKAYYEKPSIVTKSFTPFPVVESPSVAHDTSKKIVIVADYKEEDTAVKAMIDEFVRVFPYETDVINIEEFPFKGSCVSCFNCSTSGKCIYSDGFDDFLRNTIHKHDAILYAFKIKDHSMGSRFKMYDDRQFCNGHRTVTMGTPFGYLIDGPYSTENNLQMLLEARAQVGGNFLAGVATNEIDPNAEIQKLSDSLCYALEHKYMPPQNFYGVGGMKIFRDLIYTMRGMMRADHKFFKSHGQYDFPQKKWKTSMLMYLVGWMMGNKKLKSKMGNKMNDGMISAYKKVVDNA